MYPLKNLISNLSTTTWELTLDKYNTAADTPRHNQHDLPKQTLFIHGHDVQQDNVVIEKQNIIKPTEDQLYSLSQFENYLQRDNQFLIFIHGGPGVGKTWTINELKKMDTLHRKHDSAAFTGVAASLLSGGETIHSLFHITVGKKAECYLNTTLHD
jgi:PIF1-like helicase